MASHAASELGSYLGHTLSGEPGDGDVGADAGMCEVPRLGDEKLGEAERDVTVTQRVGGAGPPEVVEAVLCRGRGCPRGWRACRAAPRSR